jgi:hypothetical protein
MSRPTIDGRRFPGTRQVLVRVTPLALMLVAVALIGYKLGWYEYRHAIEHVQRLRRTHSVVGFSVLFVIAFGIGTSVGSQACRSSLSPGCCSERCWGAFSVGSAL